MFVKNTIKALTLLLIVVSLFACRHGDGNQKAAVNRSSLITSLEGVIVKSTNLAERIMVSGTLIPFEETVLLPEISGRVVMINLPEGQFVKKGTLLVKMFDGDLQADLLKSQTQLEIAEQTIGRQSELIKVNGISQSDYDQAVLQVNSLKDDIAVVKVQIGKTEIVAPYDGIIGLRNISLGAEVTPNTALATIRAENQLKLDFSVPEKYSDRVKRGMKVRFAVDNRDEKYEATVMATEEGIESNTRNLNVRAVVESKSDSLVPGSFANVELILEDKKDALMIPTQAIIPEERDKKIIVSKNGKATFITVNTGVRQDSTVEIISGIQPGDTVVTSGILLIRPGEELKFSKIIK